jgi:hypothetical protein
MTAMRDLKAAEIRRLHRKVAAADRRLALVMLPGKVAEVDAATRTLRLELGRSADGRPILGPRSRWQEQGAGGLKVHSEPKIGEQMMLLSQSGTVGQASVAMPGTYDQDNNAPSDSSDTAVFERGGRIELHPDGIRLIGNVDLADGYVRHDGVDISKDHLHTKVEPGGGLSGPPPA